MFLMSSLVLRILTLVLIRLIQHFHLVEDVAEVERVVVGVVDGGVVFVDDFVFLDVCFGVDWWSFIKLAIIHDQQLVIFLDEHVFWTLSGQLFGKAYIEIQCVIVNMILLFAIFL
jgi:hypothetical protein